MSAKHTPGPWERELAETYNVRAPHGGRVAILCHLKGRHGLGGRLSPVEASANANLIAAAPELLDALEGALADDVIRYHAKEWVQKARAAIAKATGEAV